MQHSVSMTPTRLNPMNKLATPCHTIPRISDAWVLVKFSCFAGEITGQNANRTPCDMTTSLQSRSFSDACSTTQRFGNHLTSLGHTIFRDNRIGRICPVKPLPTALHSQHRSLPMEFFPKLFPTVSCPSMLPFRPLPTELSPSCPSVHASDRFRLPPPNEALSPSVSCPSTLPSRTLPTSSPQAISHGFLSVSPPQPISHGFLMFPVRPRFHLAPSQRRFPQAISHGLLSVHDVDASVLLPPRRSKLNENPSPKHRRCFWEKQPKKCLKRFVSGM